MARPVVPGDPAKDAALKEWLKSGKQLLAKAERKNYDLDTFQDLYIFCMEQAAAANVHMTYRLKQSHDGRIQSMQRQIAELQQQINKSKPVL